MTLRKIKSEYVLKNRISTDIYLDAEATKILTDSICIPGKTKLSGYIQEITLNPFGVFFLSDLNVSSYINHN